MTATGLYLVACATIVVAGVAKAARPGDTVRAVRSLVPALGSRLTTAGLRIAAAAEVVLGVAGVIEPRPAIAGAVAASYAAFAGFVIFARARGGALATCGCFGTPDTPATRLHVVLDLTLAGAAAVVAVDSPARNMVAELGRQPLSGIPTVCAAAVGTALVIVAMTSLARLGAVRASLSTPSPGRETGPTRSPSVTDRP